MADALKSFLSVQGAKAKARLSNAVAHAIAEHCDERIAAKDAEIERLKSALNKIVNNWGNLHPKDRQQALIALGRDPVR